MITIIITIITIVSINSDTCVFLNNQSGFTYCFKTEHTTTSFLNGFKISDVDQLILALIFRFGVILVQEIGRKV